MGLKRMWADAKTKVENKTRAEVLVAAGAFLRGLADQVDGTDMADLRRGLLAGAGFLSVMAAALESGTNELAFIDIDGDRFPVDLTMTAKEGEE